MIIISDSNEVRPLEFFNPMIEKVSREKIWVPKTRFSLDYGVRFRDGHTPKVFFERKGISDLFGTMGSGYPRFKRKIIACQKTNTTMIIIIEGTMSRIQSWDNPHAQKYSTRAFTGEAMIKKLFTLWNRYGILSVYCRDRQEMAEYISQFYISLGKEYIRKKGVRRL